MDVSETMKSVRFLFEKHLRKYDSSDKAIPVEAAKDVVKGAKVELNCIFEILRLHREGLSNNAIARHLSVSAMTVGNIILRRKAYASLPETYPEINKWFKERNKE